MRKVELSRSGLHHQRSALRGCVTAALQAAGFTFDPKDPAQTRSRDESSYMVWHLPYSPPAGAGEGLRPTIKVELNFAPLRRPTVTLAVASFVAEAMKRTPEVLALACVGVIETAAEKLVALTRKTAMDLAGASRDPRTRRSCGISVAARRLAALRALANPGANSVSDRAGNTA